jgi:hypothetical protein
LTCSEGSQLNERGRRKGKNDEAEKETEGAKTGEAANCGEGRDEPDGVGVLAGGKAG